MTARLKFSLVTPNNRILEQECDEVRIPGTSGYFGVLPGHAPLLTTIAFGPLHVFDGKQKQAFAVIGGFAQISNDNIFVMAERALPLKSVSVAEERVELEAARIELCRAGPHRS